MLSQRNPEKYGKHHLDIGRRQEYGGQRAEVTPAMTQLTQQDYGEESK